MTSCVELWPYAAGGQVRLPATFVWRAGLGLMLVPFPELPVAALFTLAILAAGFEAVEALQVG
jgi:hypothetical protein